MSKTKAFVLTILFLVMTILFWVVNNLPFALVTLLAAIATGAIFLMKQRRDQAIRDAAQREQETLSQRPHTVARTNNDSHGLFVPPPLREK